MSEQPGRKRAPVHPAYQVTRDTALRILKPWVAWAGAAQVSSALAGEPPQAAAASTQADANSSLAMRARPRVPLVVISRGRFSAHVLPQSHVGYAGEFGAGFHEQVLPAARRARTLVHEAANLDPWVDWQHWWRSCLDDRTELAGFNARLASRIVAHHWYSK